MCVELKRRLLLSSDDVHSDRDHTCSVAASAIAGAGVAAGAGAVFPMVMDDRRL